MEDQNWDEAKLKRLLSSKNLPNVFDWSMFEGFHLWESATCHNPISRITWKELNHVSDNLVLCCSLVFQIFYFVNKLLVVCVLSLHVTRLSWSWRLVIPLLNNSPRVQDYAPLTLFFLSLSLPFANQIMICCY